MTVQKYDDGIAFLKDGAEIAFYSYIVNRIAFYPQSNEEWSDCRCSFVRVEDLIFIINIVKIERKKLIEVEIK